LAGGNLAEDALVQGEYCGTYHYPRPEPGEKIPIQVLNFKKVFAAWSPDLGKTCYFEELPENESLKRIREIILLHVYDWLACRKGLIELTNSEFDKFMDVYEAFLQKLGEIQYGRQKKGRRMENIFELEESAYVIREVKGEPFSDKL
jgi:hypothetical protein